MFTFLLNFSIKTQRRAIFFLAFRIDVLFSLCVSCFSFFFARIAHSNYYRAFLITSDYLFILIDWNMLIWFVFASATKNVTIVTKCERLFMLMCVWSTRVFATSCPLFTSKSKSKNINLFHFIVYFYGGWLWMWTRYDIYPHIISNDCGFAEITTK